MDKLLICGAGGHAKVVIEIINENKNYEIVGLTEIDRSHIGRSVCGVPIIDEQMNLHKYFMDGIKYAFIAIGNVKNYKPREEVFITLKRIGFSLANIYSNKSIISPSATFGEGNFVGACAIINACAGIGNNCIVNTGAIVEHDCVIGDNVHIASGATVLGAVRIGQNSLVGAGSTIKQSVVIGKNCVIGAGSVVIKDVADGAKVAGVPAKNI